MSDEALRPTHLPMHELELKFRVPEERLAELQEAFELHGAQRIRLRAHYFDTAQGDLARHAVALRLRLEGASWVQTLKATGEGVVHRLEHEVAVAGTSAEVPAIDVHRHDGSAAGLALAAVLKHASTPLGACYATDIERWRCLLNDADGTSLEAALDIGSVAAAGSASAVAELELEHKGGPVQGLFHLAQVWARHGGLSLSTLSKAERGQRLLRGEPAAAAVRFSAARIGRDADGPTLMRALLQAALQQVVGNASTLGNDDGHGDAAPEVIHQLRIGLRRVRTLLRELGPLVADVPAAWEQALAGTFRRLGRLRDADVVAAAVQPLLLAAQAPLLGWQAQPAGDPVLIAREPDFQAALLGLLALAHADDSAFAPLHKAQARKLLAHRLDKLHRRIARDAASFATLDAHAQHDIRKRLKRLRYLADMTASVWPRRALRRHMKQLALAQDALGRHMDVAVAATAFREEAATRPAAWFAAGYLQAHLAVTGAEAQRALVAAMAVAPFWR